MDEASGGGKPTVLVVDDESLVQDICAEVLRGRCHLLQATSAKEGFALACREKPDVVLTDYDVPGVKGTNLCRWIREAPQLDRTRVIIMSRLLSLGVMEAAFRAGADNLLPKPFGMKELLSVLEF